MAALCAAALIQSLSSLRPITTRGAAGSALTLQSAEALLAGEG